jgi:hypothetical protein
MPNIANGDLFSNPNENTQSLYSIDIQNTPKVISNSGEKLHYLCNFHHSNLTCLCNIEEKVLNLRQASDTIKGAVNADLSYNYCIKDTNTARSTSASKSDMSFSATKPRKAQGAQLKEKFRDLGKQRNISEQTIQRMKDQCQGNVKKIYLKKYQKSFKVF